MLLPSLLAPFSSKSKSFSVPEAGDADLAEFLTRPPSRAETRLSQGSPPFIMILLSSLGHFPKEQPGSVQTCAREGAPPSSKSDWSGVRRSRALGLTRLLQFILVCTFREHKRLAGRPVSFLHRAGCEDGRADQRQDPPNHNFPNCLSQNSLTFPICSSISVFKCLAPACQSSVV